MNTSLRIAAFTVVVTLLAACGSTPPSRYYMLNANAASAPTHDGVRVGIGPITIPDYLEPLESGITRVLILNLASLLDTRQVTVFPWRSDDTPDYAVSVGMVQFTAHQDDALLVASWTVQRPHGDELVEQSLSKHSLALTSKDPSDVAEVYSGLLQLLSEDIASAIRQDAGKR